MNICSYNVALKNLELKSSNHLPIACKTVPSVVSTKRNGIYSQLLQHDANIYRIRYIYQPICSGTKFSAYVGRGHVITRSPRQVDLKTQILGTQPKSANRKYSIEHTQYAQWAVSFRPPRHTLAAICSLSQPPRHTLAATGSLILTTMAQLWPQLVVSS